MAGTRARKLVWDEIETDHPMTLLDRQRVMGEKMTVARVTLHEGLYVPTHQHENEQMAIVLSGRIEFKVGSDDTAETLVLGGGEVLHIPSDVPHAARALEESLVIDVFSPAADKTGIDSD